MRTLINFIVLGLSQNLYSQSSSFAINYDSIKGINNFDTCTNIVRSEFGFGYLIEPDYRSLISNGIGYYKDNSIWAPNEIMVLDFEDNLKRNIDNGAIKIFAKEPKKYVRQYVGIQDSAKNKILLINFYYLETSYADSVKNYCLHPFSYEFTRWHWEKYGYDFIMLYFIENKKILIWNNSINRGW